MASLNSERVQLIGILKIPSGQDSSLDHTPAAGTPERKYISAEQMAGFSAIMIATPEDAFTGAVTVRALYDPRPAVDADAEASYVTVQSPPGTDVTIAALKGIVLTALPFPSLIVMSAAAEADEATFYVLGWRGGK